MSLPSLPNDFKVKSFWDRPEGTAGMLVTALFAVGGFFLLKAILPTVNEFLDLAISAGYKMFVLGGMAALAGLLLAVVTNKRFQLAFSHLFKLSMRALTGVIIEIDPIGIMKNYIDTLREKKALFDQNKAQLKGQIRECDQQIDSNDREIAKAESLARAAQNNGNRGQLAVHGRNAERLTEQNTRMKSTRTKMEMLYQMLNKYAEATDLVIQDMENDVKAREQDRRFSKTAHSAMRSAMAILKGDGVDKQLYDEAMEYALTDYANKMGEIEDFMVSTKTIMEGIDLQNGVWEQAALDRLQAVESQTDSLLLGGTKRLMIEQSSSMSAPAMTINVGANVPTGGYDNFFNSK